MRLFSIGLMAYSAAVALATPGEAAAPDEVAAATPAVRIDDVAVVEGVRGP